MPGGGGGGGSGTVTSVGVSAGTTRLSVSGSPIVSSGTISLSTTDGFPLVTQAYSGSVAGHIATFNNTGGTQIADCGIGVTSSPLAIVPPSTMSLGTSSYKWGDFYLTGTTHWGSYDIAAPTGSTNLYLRNDGTWAIPGTAILSSNNTWSGTNLFQPTNGINVGGSSTSNSMLLGYNGAAINFYSSNTGNDYNSLYYSATGTSLAAQQFSLSYNNSGTANAIYQFYGDGTAKKPGGGSWTATSDGRLKSNVTPLTNSLAKITALNPVSYTWNIDSTEPTVGFVAQEVQTVLPNAVTSHNPTEEESKFIDDKTLSIGWQNDMTAYLVGAIKELKAVIDVQATEILALKEKVGA